jgi:hypothetical protein
MAKRAAFTDRMGKVAFKVQRGFGTDSAQPAVRFF